MDIAFGRLESAFDERDYDLKEFMPSGIFGFSPITSKSWMFNSQPLSQGIFPHCVGFSMANFGISEPVQTPLTNKDGHDFYYLCKEIEGRPKVEEGSTMRAAAKALKQLGKIQGYAFARDVNSIKWWILNRGPVLAGTLWTEGMMNTDINNRITISGNLLGGHAYLLTEWTSDNYIGIQNSWGNDWGIKGKAYISSTDFAKIFARGGEAMTAVEVATPSFVHWLFNK